MKILTSVFLLVVALFAALNFFKVPDAPRQAPPTNNATVFFENAWRIVKRCVLEGIFRAALYTDRIFGLRTPFALGIDGDDADINKKLMKSLDELSIRLKKVDDLDKAGGEHKAAIEKQTKAIEELTLKMQELQRQRITVMGGGSRLRAPGSVSDECAKHLASHFILHCERSNKLEALASDQVRREGLVNVAKGYLGISAKTAISTADIPLPVEYGSEINELISEICVVRRRMSAYPIGMGTARPPRMGTRPAFGSIAMSGAMTEKSPTITFASLESHKIGGLVRLPREIDEQSIVPMGQFLARYGAIEFARAEDTWGFLADGSGTYEAVSGVVKIATDNNKSVVLAAATGPQDATLADFRAMRTKVNKAALSAKLSAYYLDSTWETRLPTFKTEADPFAYVRNADGSATLDGYPIVWTDVLEPYAAADVVSKPLAVFGALQFWWMGEHGSPRIDTSEHVFFANDQLATRFIEEIDFDYAALDAASVLLTGAAS